MAEIFRLRRFEKLPEQLLKDLSEHKDWQHIVVVGTYQEDGETYIDAWHNSDNGTMLIGMLMRAILEISTHANTEQ